MLDIDSVVLPKSLRVFPYTDDHAAYVRGLLPEAFAAAGCVWQASASAGTDVKVAKLHLWFLLDAPLTSAQLRQWLKGTEHVDPVTWRTVQPHYTADPIGGPEGKRLGVLKGPRVTTPLDITAIEPEPAAAPLTKRPKGCADVSDAQIEGAFKAAIKRARATLTTSASAYLDAYKAGTYFGAAVALKTWNDKKRGHETWRDEAERLAVKWGERFAALPDTKHGADAYTARVLEGIAWGVAMERDRLAQQSAKTRRMMEEAAREMQEQILARLAKNAGSEKALHEAGAQLGKYKEVLGEQKVIDTLRLHSGLSEQQCKASIADAKPVDLSAWREGLLMQRDEILATDANIVAIFSRYPGFADSFRVNARTAELELTETNIFRMHPGAIKPRAMVQTLVTWLDSIGCRKSAAYKVREMFEGFVERMTSYDPFLVAFPEALLPAAEACEQLATLKPRLDKWLHRHLGVERGAYADAAAAKTLIAAVARAVRPGAQVDTMLVLMGEQGIGKTSVVRTLASVIPSGYQELLDTRDKDSLLVMQRGLLVEVSELRALRGAQEESLKAFFTRKTDFVRAPYARTAEEHQRRMVFIGTTNDDDFLSDRANRRYWPVACTKICTMTRKQAVQLWREAALRYAAGEQWWLTSDEAELQAEAAHAVRAVNPYELVLAKQLRSKTKVSFLDAARMCVPEGDVFRHSIAISKALKALGWVKKHTAGGNRWVRVHPSRRL